MLFALKQSTIISCPQKKGAKKNTEITRCNQRKAQDPIIGGGVEEASKKRNRVTESLFLVK